MNLSAQLRWILDHWTISSGEYAGQLYSFKGYEFLFDLLNDEHPNQVVQKSAQCGISEKCVGKVFYLVDTRKGNILYVFPADHQMREFSNGRIKNAVTSNPYLLANIRAHLTSSQIQYRTNFIYCRGSQNRRQMISVDASALFIDEIDECEPANIVTVEKRLGAAKYPIIEKVSTPTFPNRGINHYYNNESDKRSWHIKCESCGEWQIPNFFLNVMIPDSRGSWRVPTYEDAINPIDLDFRCSKCNTKLDRHKPGEWVAELPSKSDECHGYHISKLFASKVSLPELWRNYKNLQNEAEFWNSDLGLPYSGQSEKITVENLDKARNKIAPYRMSSSSVEATTMGVDVGKLLHFVIGKKRMDGLNQIIKFGAVATWKEIFDLHPVFKVKMCVIDGLPPQPELQELLKTVNLRSRCKLAFFGESKDYTKQNPKVDINVSLNRILFCDTLIRNYAETKIALPIDAHSLYDGDFYKHLTAIQRVHEIDKKTGDTKVTHVNPFPGRQDHWFFASGYQQVASELVTIQAKQFMESLL